MLDFTPPTSVIQCFSDKKHQLPRTVQGFGRRWRMPQTSTSPKLSFTRVGHSGPRVLLIMGYGMRGKVWKPQVDELRTHCQLLFFDNRGIGESDAIGHPISMKDMAHDSLRVLDEVEWTGEVHVVGVSMGGMIAQELALCAPTRCASLTLIATHAGGPAKFLPPGKGIVRFVATQLAPANKRPQALAKLLYPRSFLESCNHEQLASRMKLQMGDATSRTTMRRQLAAIRNHDTRARLPTLTLPTLIVKPEKDILVKPRHSDELHERIVGSSLMQLPDAGHGVIFQSAKDLNRRLLEHFQRGSDGRKE